MSKFEEDDLVQPLVSAFQDTRLGTSHHNSIPFVQDETAQSHLFRIIDFLNPEIWEDPSTSAMSKEVIITLLHCAARLYEGRVHIKEAVALIENEDTRAILSLGIQGNLSQVIHQRCVESIRSNKSEAVNAENFPQQAGLFSVIRKNKARQLNHQAMIIEHISALCRSHDAALQNTCDSPRIDEPFMFRNFIMLSKNLNVCERSWLVTLLPDLFQWESQESCGEANRFNDRLLTPSLAIITETNNGIGTDKPEVITSSKDANSPYVIHTAKQTASSSCERDMQHWPGKAAAEGGKGIMRICDNWTAHGFHDQTTHHREESTLVRKKTEREYAWSRDAQYGQVLPSGDNPDGGWDLLERDDDSECIFLFSPPAYSDTSNRKPVAPLTPRGASTHWKKLYDHIDSAKARGYSKEAWLEAIPEESEGQREAEEERVKESESHEAELETTDPSE